MNRLAAVARLELLVQGRWNLVNQHRARTDLTKADKREFINQYKLDVEALNEAIRALKNPGYVYSPQGVSIETGADDDY